MQKQIKVGSVDSRAAAINFGMSSGILPHWRHAYNIQPESEYLANVFGFRIDRIRFYDEQDKLYPQELGENSAPFDDLFHNVSGHAALCEFLKQEHKSRVRIVCEYSNSLNHQETGHFGPNSYSDMEIHSRAKTVHLTMNILLMIRKTPLALKRLDKFYVARMLVLDFCNRGLNLYKFVQIQRTVPEMYRAFPPDSLPYFNPLSSILVDINSSFDAKVRIFPWNAHRSSNFLLTIANACRLPRFLNGMMRIRRKYANYRDSRILILEKFNSEMLIPLGTNGHHGMTISANAHILVKVFINDPKTLKPAYPVAAILKLGHTGSLNNHDYECLFEFITFELSIHSNIKVSRAKAPLMF